MEAGLGPEDRIRFHDEARARLRPSVASAREGSGPRGSSRRESRSRVRAARRTSCPGAHSSPGPSVASPFSATFSTWALASPPNATGAVPGSRAPERIRHASSLEPIRPVPLNLSTIPYLRWAKTEQRRGEILLTLSAVPPVGWDDIDLDPADLELCQYSAYGDRSLVSSLATECRGNEDEVLLASSASHVHFCFAAAHLSAGDRVLYESPGYLPLVDSLSMFQVEAVRFVRPFEDGYRLPMDRLESIVDQMRPRLLLVTNLHNPSGVALSVEEREFLAGLCDRFGVLVLCDEVYRPFLDPDPGPLSLLHPGILSVNSFNKAYGLPQIRVGWGHGSQAVVERARRVLDATTVHNSCLSDQVAAAAWQRRDSLIERSRRLARTSWAATGPWMRAAGLEVVPPAGGVVCFPRVPPAFGDGDLLREALLGVGVGTTPGRFFGCPSHFRLGFGLPAPQLLEAQRRIDGVLSVSSQ